MKRFTEVERQVFNTKHPKKKPIKAQVKYCGKVIFENANIALVKHLCKKNAIKIQNIIYIY